MYVTIAQLIAQFGETELIQRTDRSKPKTGAIDQALLNEIIDAASREIDGYLRSVYPLPLSDGLVAGSALPEKCGAIVRYHLYKGVKNEDVSERYNDAVKWLKGVQSKDITLGPTDATVAETGTMRVRQGISRTDWGSY
ncbi:MAG: DUF1320 domain-containing protein [Methylovulum miyakonense]|uniref:gp436 family protein n=1 Tax=Methylovulum miyakonense TaxID=645578 RepID=UPI003BB5AF82